MRTIPSSFARQGRRLLAPDVIVAALAPYFAFILRGVDWTPEAFSAFARYWALGAGFSLLLLAHFRVGRILPHLLSRRDMSLIVKMAATSAAFTAVTAFLVWRLDLIPRSLPILHFIALVGLLAGWRSAAGAFERRSLNVAPPASRAPRVSILIVGAGPTASLFIRLLKSLNDVRPNIVGLLDDDKRLHGRSVDGHVILGGLDRFEPLVAELASHGVALQRVLIAHLDPAAQSATREAIADACAARGIELEVITERLGIPSFDAAGKENASTLAMSKSKAHGYLETRRYADAALALAGLVAFGPAIALIALAIRVRLGPPVTFWQQRVGLNGDPIVVHKFRTFAPAVDPSGRILSDEERATTFGRFLRAVRLDELPQLYDVLRGHMSLIGPRPLLPADLPDDHAIRQSVVPGLTGWAQIHGGKEITTEEKNALDEWYVYHASPALDLRILWTTLRIVISGDARKNDAIAEAVEFQTLRLAKEAAEQSAAWAGAGQIVDFPRPDNLVVLPQAGTKRGATDARSRH